MNYDSLTFRSLAANEHPDQDTIAVFRRYWLGQVKPLFVQLLALSHGA